MSRETKKIVKFAERIVIPLFLVTFLVGLFVISQVSAQPTISLSINRIGSGYSYGSDMNGEFTVSAQVSSDVARVEFYLNGTLQYNDTAAPFSWTANSNDYPIGSYNITAVAYDSSGQQASAVLNENFVDISAINTITEIVIPISIILTIISIFYKFSKKSKLTKCPKCGYVFPKQRNYIVHFGTATRNKCPQCGNSFWAKDYKGTPDNDEKPVPSEKINEEERLQKDIYDSKYEHEKY